MSTTKRCTPEFWERGVRLVEEHQQDGKSHWSVMQAISQKLGCTLEPL